MRGAVYSACEALIAAVASDNGIDLDMSMIVGVEVTPGEVTVAYLDPDRASRTPAAIKDDPLPIKRITALVKYVK